MSPKTAAAVSVRLEGGDAIVHCGAFVTASGKPKPTKTEDVLAQRFVAVSVDSVASLTITGLVAATDYTVYCATESFAGAFLTLDNVLLRPAAVSMDCCKTVLGALSATSVYTGSAAVNALTVALESLPSASVAVHFSVVDTETSSAGDLVVSPASISFTSTSVSSSAKFTLIGVTPGVYYIQATVSGTSAAEYPTGAVTVATFTVLNNQAPPAVPQLKSVAFSSDGSSVLVTFDSPTNRAGYTNSFPCTTLLSFTGASAATCAWTDDSTIMVYPSSTATLLNVDQSTVSIVSTSTLRARCNQLATICAKYDPVPASSATLSAPATPLTPVVVLSMASTLAGCNALTVDLSASSGSGGRAWVKPAFAVFSADADTSAVATYLNRNFTLSPPTVVPNSMFPDDGAYTITARMCNFLGACSTTSRTVTVTKGDGLVPSVTILGQQQRTISRSTALLLTPRAFTLTCNDTKSTSRLSYSWTVSSNGVALSGMPTESLDVSKYRLSAFRLSALTYYDVKLTVTSDISKLSSSAVATVYVEQAALAAQVAGGSTQAIAIGRTLQLDASSSRDPDVNGLTGAGAGLSFAWSCVQTAPTYFTSCALGMSGASAEKVTLSADNSAIGTTSIITVKVFDATRSSTSTVAVQAQDSSAPVVGITSSAQSVTKVNPSDRLALTATVTVQSSCTAEWSVDEPSITLKTAAITPISSVIPTGTTRTVYLGLASNVLPLRAALQFTLSCGTSLSTIVVTTNGPPLPGTFTVTPSTGSEVSTPFSFSAAVWSDPDLPLSYQFGFMTSSSGVGLVAQGRSEASYTSTTMPAGDALDQFHMTCTVTVFDVLNAASKAQTVVTVAPMQDKQELQKAMLDQLTSSAGNNDAVKNAVAVGSAVINAVSCADAPSCATYNREACSKVQNTCGACLTGYVGEAGDKNAMCVSVGAASTVTTEGTGSDGSSCASNADCTGWLTCNTQLSSPVCYLADKTCPDRCFDHGSCSKLNTNSMKPVGVCKAGDPSCVAVCTCDMGYSGANCAQTVADVAAKQVVRTQFLQSLSSVAATDDVTAETVSVLCDNLYTLTQNSFELSEESVVLVSQITEAILSNADTLKSFSYEQAAGVLQSIDAAAAASIRLNTTNTAATTGDLMKSVAKFNALMASQLVAGQTNVEYVQDTFRINSIRQLRGFNSSLRILSPSNLLERSAGAAQSAVTVELTDSEARRLSDSDAQEEFSLTMVTSSASSYGSAGLDFNGNPVQVTVSRSSADPTRVTMVLVHNSAVEFTSMEEARAMAFNTTCTGAGDTHVETFECPLSGTVLTNECFGQAGVLTAYCPMRAPSCAVLDSATGTANTESANCEVVSYDQHSTTCSCTVEPTVTRRRLSGDLQQSGVLDAVSVSIYIGSQFEDTFSSADDLTSLAALKRVLIVILMFTTLWACGILLLCGCTWRLATHKPKHAMDDQNLDKKLQNAQNSKSANMAHQYLTDYVIETFPSVFSNKPFFSRLYGEVKRHHRYLTVLTAPEGENGNKQRILVGVELLTVQTMLMFLLAVLYDLQGPSDDGTCYYNLSEESCLHRKSVIDASQTYCLWVPSSQTSEFHCVYNEPTFTLKIVLYIAVMVSIFVSIISFPIDRIFELLSAPVAEDSKVALQDTALKRLGRRASNVARRASNFAMSAASAAAARVNRATTIVGTVTRQLPGSTETAHALAAASMTVIAETTRKTIRERQMSQLRSFYTAGGKYGKADNADSDSESGSSRSSASDAFSHGGARMPELLTDGSLPAAPRNGVQQTPTRELLLKLAEEVQCQRRLLKPEEVDEFDTQWGLDPTGEFVNGDRTVANCFRGRASAEDLILHELEDVTAQTMQKAEKLNIASDAHTGLEILHLFIKDLLGRDTPAAIIFETKSAEDFKHTKVVTKTMKRLAMLLLVGINFFFVYYAMLTGYRRGINWQRTYLMACIIQFVTEIVLFETMECVWVNCCIPVLVSSEVRRVGESITEVVRNLCSNVHADTNIFLNAPDYLFVSTNVAKKFPHLMESILVQAYTTHLPGELARKWQVGAIARNQRMQRLRHATLLGSMLGVLQYLGTAPFVVQRLFIRFVQPFFFSGLVLLWSLIVSNPIYIIAASILTVALLAYCAYRYHIDKVATRAKLVSPISAEYLCGPQDQDKVLTDGDDDNAVGSLNQAAIRRSMHSRSDHHSSSGQSRSNGSSGHKSDDRDSSSELSSIVSATVQARQTGRSVAQKRGLNREHSTQSSVSTHSEASSTDHGPAPHSAALGTALANRVRVPFYGSSSSSDAASNVSGDINLETPRTQNSVSTIASNVVAPRVSVSAARQGIAQLPLASVASHDDDDYASFDVDLSSEDTAASSGGVSLASATGLSRRSPRTY
jgi:hypothetical protein